MNRKLLGAMCAAIALAATLARSQESPSDPDPVTEWSSAASVAAEASGMAPLRVPITFAILHLAMYDAVYAVGGGRELYAAQPSVSQPASAHAAAMEAGYSVAIAELPSQRVALDATYQKLLKAVPEGTAKSNGITVGAAVARQLLARRATDGRNLGVPFAPENTPGAWVPTPPERLPATTAFLATITPFTMQSPSEFRPAGPPSFESKRWSSDYNEVKAFGAKQSSKRTSEQTATGWFWEPAATTVWPATIRRLAREQRLDLAASAHFQAAAFAALADGLIACWDAKFHYKFWRPVTAIADGASDANPETAPDALWEPLAVTPAFPEYPSGHTCVTAAVAHVIEGYFPQGVVIRARNVVTGEERVFRKADDVVNEVIEARMLIGVHFRSANEDGAEIGRQIARRIHGRWFKRAARSYR